MSRLTKLEVFDPFCHYSSSAIFPPFFLEEDELVEDLASFVSFSHRPRPAPDPFELFETVTGLIRVGRANRRPRPDPEKLLLKGLVERVSALEERLAREEREKEKERERERKYTWTAEIKEPGSDRKYQWSSVSEGKKERKYKWTAEIKGSGDHSRKYSFEVSNAEKKKKKDKDIKEEKEKEKKKVGPTSGSRLVEIEGSPPPPDHGAIVLRQAFARRARVSKAGKGKYKELSPQDAALLIQMTFRAYLIRRSQALRALRELAIAKTKMKEIRASFNNFSYRRQIARDAAERQSFSEKIIVLLLTVDAIEGVDVMVRGAKRSMVDELEAMLDVVDPQPAGKSLSMRRRTFNMPDGVIRGEIAESVARVVQMLDDEEHA